MASSNGGNSSTGKGAGARPPVSPARPGGNWPSKTGGVSGGGRGNAVPPGKAK